MATRGGEGVITEKGRDDGIPSFVARKECGEQGIKPSKLHVRGYTGGLSGAFLCHVAVLQAREEVVGPNSPPKREVTPGVESKARRVH